MSLITGCAQAIAPGSGSSESFATSCHLPDNQSSTILGRWPITPVPLAVEASGFSAAELSAITSAVQTWNTFYEFSVGFPLFDIGSASTPRTTNTPKPTIADICLSGLISGNQYSGSVRIQKTTSWSADPDIIALTHLCHTPDAPVNRYYMSVLELNFENFYISGKRLPDLQSIVLHELGHLAGLAHSCEGTDVAGRANCNSGNLPSEYFEAVMYPIIFFPDGIHGEQRRSLRKNDQERANCLYADVI